MKNYKTILLIVLIGLIACTAASYATTQRPPEEAPGKIEPVSHENVISGSESEKQKEQNYLVLYFSPKCGACNRMEAALMGYVKSPSALPLYRVNVDSTGGYKTLETFHIRTIPTIIQFKNHEEVWRSVGVIPVEDLPKNEDSKEKKTNE